MDANLNVTSLALNGLVHLKYYVSRLFRYLPLQREAVKKLFKSMSPIWKGVDPPPDKKSRLLSESM